MDAGHYIPTDQAPLPKYNPCSSTNMGDYAEPEFGTLIYLQCQHFQSKHEVLKEQV